MQKENIKMIMSNAEKLKDIRTYHGYTQQQIANILCLERSTYTGWETGKKTIPLKHLNTLANYYEVSIDYLLGLTDEMRKTTKIDLDIDIAIKNFITIKNENKLSRVKFAKMLNMSESTLRDYENKKYFLSTYIVYNLARVFNISVDWLLGKSNIKNII